MGKTQQQYIQSITEKKTREHHSFTPLARLLNQQMTQLFHDPRSFIYELLQNADDAEAGSVTFSIEGTDLVMQHDGQPFNKLDVKRICDAARDSDTDQNAKTQQQKKIGYKGIGFKSVFGISKHVTILSHETGYYFEFNQNAWRQQETAKIKYPWQILPIFINSPDALYAQYKILQENIAFIMHDIDLQRVKHELIEIISHPEILVFFRHVSDITLQFEKNCRIRREELKIKLSPHNTSFKEKLLSIQIKDQPETIWYRSKLAVDVPETVKEAIKKLPPTALPPKIKTATQTQLTFAAMVVKQDDGQYQFHSIVDSDLYCYLPTSVECGLPFLVNANFALSQDRNTIVDNPWNEFLLKQIGLAQFQWFGEVALKKQFRYGILNLLSDANAATVFPSLERRYRQRGKDVIENALLTAYNTGCQQAIESVAFIPSKQGALLRLNQAVLDQTHFFKEFDEFKWDPKLIDQTQSRLVSYDLTKCEVLQGYPQVFQFNWESLLNSIESYLTLARGQEHRLVRSSMVNFLFASDRHDAFLQKRILHDREGKLCVPSQSFYHDNPNVDNPYPLFNDIHIIDLNAYQAATAKQIQTYVDQLTAASLLSKHVAKLIFEGKITAENSIAILRFIYTACQQDELDIQLLGSNNLGEFELSRFPVLTQAGQMRQLQACIFQQEQLQLNMPEKLITQAYFRVDDDMQIWRSLLLAAGVQSDIAFESKKMSFNELYQHFQNKFQLGEQFSNYVDQMIAQVPTDNTGIPKSSRTQLYKQKLIFENFILFDFLLYENVLSDSLLHLFFMTANKQSRLLNSKPKIKRGIKKQESSITLPIHFYAYYFRENCKLNAIGQQQAQSPSSLLYFEHFTLAEQQLLQKSLLLVSLPGAISLKTSIAESLGFRTGLKIKEGLKLLADLALSYQNKKVDHDCITQLQFIYQLILNINIKESDREVVAKWKQNNDLLASNQQFVNASSLEVYDGEGMPEEDAQMHWLNPVGLEISKLKKIASIFAMPCFSDSTDFTASLSEMETFKKDIAQLYQFVEKVLPIYTMKESMILKSPLDSLHKQMYARYVKLKLIPCDSVTFPNGRRQQSCIISKRHNIYIVGRISGSSSTQLSELAKQLAEYFQFASSQIQSEFKNTIQQYRNKGSSNEVIRWVDGSPQCQEQYASLLDYQKSCQKQQSDGETSDTSSDSELSTDLSAVQKRFDFGKSEMTDSEIDSDTFPDFKTPTQMSSQSPLQTPPQTPTQTPPQTPTETETKFSPRFFQTPPQEDQGDIEFSPSSSGGKKTLPKLGNSKEKIPSKHKRKSKKKTQLSEEEQAEKDQRNKALGDLGESRTYWKLCQILQNSTGIEPAPINEAIGGDGAGPGMRFEKEGRKIDLIWYNKNRDPLSEVYESPVDMIIRLNEQVIYYIEVKSTESQNNPIFHLTTNEWDYMLQKRQQSILVRVYQTIENQPTRFEVYRDPFGMISKHLIAFMTGGKFRLNIESAQALGEHNLQDYEDKDLGCKVM